MSRTGGSITETVQSGVYKGYRIRRARKAGPCEFWRGAAGKCGREIKVGDRYVAGELRDFGSPFAQKRYCMDCVEPTTSCGEPLPLGGGSCSLPKGHVDSADPVEQLHGTRGGHRS